MKRRNFLKSSSLTALSVPFAPYIIINRRPDAVDQILIDEEIIFWPIVGQIARAVAVKVISEVVYDYVSPWFKPKQPSPPPLVHTVINHNEQLTLDVDINLNNSPVYSQHHQHHEYKSGKRVPHSSYVKHINNDYIFFPYERVKENRITHKISMHDGTKYGNQSVADLGGADIVGIGKLSTNFSEKYGSDETRDYWLPRQIIHMSDENNWKNSYRSKSMFTTKKGKISVNYEAFTQRNGSIPGLITIEVQSRLINNSISIKTTTPC